MSREVSEGFLVFWVGGDLQSSSMFSHFLLAGAALLACRRCSSSVRHPSTQLWKVLLVGPVVNFPTN